MNKYAQLHEYLRAALDDLRGRIPDGDRARITIQAVIDYEGEYEIKYSVSKPYDSGPTGNTLGPVMDEYFRRNGWDLANNTKLLEDSSRSE